MIIASEIRATGLGVFPCTLDKSPAIPRGTDWRELAQYPTDAHIWPTEIVGVPIPPGVVVIDLDTYKGVTREQVDQLLGVALPWDEALLQTTMQGGQHYAFRCDWDVMQGSGLLGLDGFDTRVGTKGYICTGMGYTNNGFGVSRMADRDALPTLPSQCQPVIGRTEPTLQPATVTKPPPDMPEVVSALACIDPACSRGAWVKIGMALRAWAGDDPDGTGVMLFEQWSSGVLGEHDTPHNYVPEHIAWQYESFKPQGDTTVGSLFYEAIQSGWKPPSRMDTALAFGPGAADMNAFNDMVDSINSHGCDPKQTASLTEAVEGMGGNKLQTATLLALLTRELKQAGLLTKPVREQLDGMAGDTNLPRMRGEYGKNHTENATLYLERFYPQGGLVRSEQCWYSFDKRIWTQWDDDDLKGTLARDMLSSLPQDSTVSGTYGMLGKICHQTSAIRINNIPDHLIIFENGILDLLTGVMGPHDAAHFTTIIMPYEYQPAAAAPQWAVFLNDIFENDAERVALLQEWFGYMLSNSYDHHKIMLMLGAPRSGKGTIGRILEQIVGPANFTGASLHAFTSDPFLDSLRTKTVAFSGDTERRVARGMVDVVIERLKKISGNDAVTFARKFKDTLSQALPTRITLAGNHVPALFDDSGALAGRLLVLPFNVCYSGREDLGLQRRLMTELPGIATWALEGLRRLTAQGKFTIPEASAEEMRFIAESFSPLTSFIHDVCRLGKTHAEVTLCNDLYSAYRAWCTVHSEAHIMAHRTFISAFKDATRGRGCSYGTQRRGDGVRGRGFNGLSVDKIEGAGTAFKPTAVKSV